MKTRNICWPGALVLGFAALLLTTTGWSAGEESVETMALAADEAWDVMPIPRGSLTGHPDFRPIRHDRLRPPSTGILPHTPAPRTAPCALYDSRDGWNAGVEFRLGKDSSGLLRPNENPCP